jgi:hypothetical protein
MTALAGATVEWEKGGLARFVTVRGDAVVLVSTVPSPPGSRIEGAMLEEPREALRIKVHICRVLPDGAFHIEGRALDMRRDVRARLEAMTDGAGVPSDPTSGPGVVPRS